MKVLLKFYSELNLGDDLFLKIILERYPHVDFYLLSDERYKIDFINKNGFNNLIIIEDRTDSRIFAKLKRRIVHKFFPKKQERLYRSNILRTYSEYFKECDFFVSIGGSIFMEKPEGFFDQDILFYKMISEYFDRENMFFLGCNFGPFKNDCYLNTYKEIFRRYKDVCFRESYSYNLFKDIEGGRFSSDIVFSLKPKRIDETIENSIGFSVITSRGVIDTEKYICKYVEIISEYVRKGNKVFLFSFCQSEGDESIIKRILSRVNDVSNIVSVFYDGDIYGFLDKYSRVEKMYCSRFHSMILSMLFNQEIHPIVYSDKMTNVLTDISYRGKYTRLSEFGRIDISSSDIFVKDAYVINHVISDSENQFIELDKALR